MNRRKFFRLIDRRGEEEEKRHRRTTKGWQLGSSREKEKKKGRKEQMKYVETTGLQLILSDSLLNKEVCIRDGL